MKVDEAHCRLDKMAEKYKKIKTAYKALKKDTKRFKEQIGALMDTFKHEIESQHERLDRHSRRFEEVMEPIKELTKMSKNCLADDDASDK